MPRERIPSVKADSGTYYKVFARLGVGGNGVTFLAYVSSPSEEKGSLAAIKFFRKRSDPSRRAAFLREVDFLRECDHPAVMLQIDEGTYRDSPFLVAEYLPSTLEARMRKSMLPLEKIFAAMHLLSALVYLHALNPAVIHRDIKPANIFEKGGSFLLGDFGLVKRLAPASEADKEALGDSIAGPKASPGVGMPRGYRTPDLVAYLRDGTLPTPASDIFQLGLVLTELFTGINPSKPFTNIKDPVELEPIGHVDLPQGAGIASILRRMLDLEPSKRPTAPALLDAWEGVLKDAIEAASTEGRVLGAEPLSPRRDAEA